MVKPRRYHAPGRRAAALRTRAAVLDAALRGFSRRGYAATTIAEVARGAGVSEETVYKRFGGKPGLVRALVERALEGAGPVPAEHRSDAMSAAERDPRAIIEGWSRFSMEVSPRVSPLLLLVRAAAAADPAMDRLRRELDDVRLARMAHNARRLRATGRVRASTRVVRDVLWTATSPELYQLLVLERGWSLRAYARHIAETTIAAVL
jgi:AcrR family transcriptional regulator